MGITFEVTYSTGSGIDHYTYTYTVSGDATIAVVIGSGTTRQFWKKSSDSWAVWSVSVPWKKNKTTGVWEAQSDWSQVFDPNTKYVKG